MTMIIKGIVPEDFVNYKLPSMFINTARCSFKCDQEAGESCCQNGSLALTPNIYIKADAIIERYLANNITKAIVFGGLEPFDQFLQMYHFIRKLREDFGCNDMVVVYTGYEPTEIDYMLAQLCQFPNIIVKFGRFIPHATPRYDEVLGVTLASENQRAIQIS